ncbi:MAG: hypothetical protein OEQ53_16355 [Saprospiraceae bacterium]|nr:hypothetical protein [Saprospiraceae bacterium]
MKKIMASVHKYLDQDISLIFLHPKSAIRYAANHHQPSTKYLISFGPGPQTLGFNFRNILYHPFSTDQCTYLFADSVLDIQSSKEEKKKLWSALKSMFA